MICSCGSGWYDGEVGEDCEECGGQAMTRPCPLCQGQCGAVWSRSVHMVSRLHIIPCSQSLPCVFAQLGSLTKSLSKLLPLQLPQPVVLEHCKD